MSQTKAFEPVLRVADSLIPKEEYGMKSAVKMALESMAAKKAAEFQKEAEEPATEQEQISEEFDAKSLLNEMRDLLDKVAGILRGWEELTEELVGELAEVLGIDMEEDIEPAPDVLVVGTAKDVSMIDIDECFAKFDWFGDSEILFEIPGHEEISFTCNEKDLVMVDGSLFLLGPAVFMHIDKEENPTSITMDDVTVICAFMAVNYGRMHFKDTDEYVFGYKIK